MAVKSPFAIERGPALVLMGTLSSLAMILGERGFAEARGPEKNMIEGFAAGARGFDGMAMVFLDAFLARCIRRGAWGGRWRRGGHIVK